MPKKVFVFNLSVSLISPTRLAGEGRMKELLGVEKLPAKMRPLLAQEVIDRKLLNPLVAIKGRARDLLLKHGSRDALLGWVVDPDRIDELMAGVKKLEEEFRREKEKVLAEYPGSCRALIESLRAACKKDGVENCEAFLEVVREAQPSIGYLRNQLGFRYLKPRAIELPEQEFNIVREGLFGQTVQEIVARAKAAKRCKGAKAKARALVELRNKLHGLGYLDARFRSFGMQIDDLLATLPMKDKEKDWPATAVFAVSGAIELLMDEARLMERIGEEEPVFDMNMVLLPGAELSSEEGEVPALAEPSSTEEEISEQEEAAFPDFDLDIVSSW